MVPDAPGGSAGAQAPDAPGVGPTGKANARDAFPFPGEASKPDGSGAGGSGGSSSSSSSSSDDGSTAADAQPGDAAGVKDAGSEGSQTPGRHILHRVNPIGTKLQTDDEREAEDLDIARYYTQTGDLQGAYLRSKDAVKMAPNDADAHFALAESALKLNKRDEAITEYNACLKLDPIDKEAKAARKELAKLKP
jgi:tetratricopeptide (TPR) repeat protein